MPVVSAVGVRVDQRGARLEAGVRILDRSARLRVHGIRPRDRGTGGCVLRRFQVQVRVGRDQLAVGAIDDVEEPVLRCLHRHLAPRSSDREVGQHDGLRRRVVPGLARRGLVVPLVRARLGVERDDRGEEQVVAAARRSNLLVPGRSIAHADEQLIELRVVHDGVPHRAAAAVLPPLAGPRGPHPFEHRVRGRIVAAHRGIARHRVEAPAQRARLCVVRRHVPAHTVLGAAVADVHESVGDAWRAGDRVGLRLVDGHGFPRHYTRRRIERHEPAVDNADEHLAAVDGDAAIDDITARLRADLATDVRVVHPALRTRLRVDSVDDAPGRRHVHHTVADDGRRFGAAIHAEVIGPRQAESGDRLRRDARERTEALLPIRAAMRQPVARFGVGTDRDAVSAVQFGREERRRASSHRAR